MDLFLKPKHFLQIKHTILLELCLKDKSNRQLLLNYTNSIAFTKKNNEIP